MPIVITSLAKGGREEGIMALLDILFDNYSKASLI
jgi:hypothetical protein